MNSPGDAADQAPESSPTLAMISSTIAYRDRGTVYTHIANSRVAAALAPHHSKVLLCTPTIEGPPRSQMDEAIDAPNIELRPQPPYQSSLGALRRPFAIVRAYRDVFRDADAVFVRGMIPYVAIFYLLAAMRGVPVCHWIIGNNLRLLLTHRRASWPVHIASILYAIQDRTFTRLGRWITGAAFITSGEELGEAFRSPRTIATASSTLRDDDFFDRDDTCGQVPARLLYVGWVRPEKGITFLLEALASPRLADKAELEIIGPWDKFPEYREQCDAIIGNRGLADRVKWTGYVAYGSELFARMRESDLLVLPSLSEGTPHVLLEAMANSLPVVATNVGGIPTCIVNGEHGLLVAPRDPEALAGAISRVIDDESLRRSIILNGRARARNHTVEQFAALILSLLAGKNARDIEANGVARAHAASSDC